MIILLTAAERILALYEAACLTYGITQVDSGMSSHRESPQSSSSISFHTKGMSGTEASPQQLLCVKSTMKFGQMELNGNYAKLLVRILLSRRLLKLCSLLEDLKQSIRRLRREDGAQHTDILKVCERSTNFTMDKVVVLIGEIR